MFGIDVLEYRDRLERDLINAGFTKLEKPANTEDTYHVGIHPDNDSDFDTTFWRPLVQKVIDFMTDDEVKEFYYFDVYFDEDALNVSVSPGDTGRW